MGLYNKNIRLIGKILFKLLIQVILKYKLQSKQVERIWIGIEYIWGG
jgi:hypothetical protein